MADSVYISQNLTRDQWRFIELLDKYEVYYFRMDEVETLLNSRFKNLNEVLENLVRKNLLVRLEKGKFARPGFTDMHVLAAFLVPDGVVGYWSALHLHGLTGRFPSGIFIKTTLRKRPAGLRGTRVQFVTVNPRKMTGNSRQGYGRSAYRLTDVECTLVDCFDLPKYAGGWPDLLSAFVRADTDSDKLIEYTRTYNKKSIIKRIGYLAELTAKRSLKPFVDFALRHTGKRYIPFDPAGPDTGKFDPCWKLRMNMTPEQILDILNNTY